MPKKTKYRQKNEKEKKNITTGKTSQRNNVRYLVEKCQEFSLRNCF